MTLFAGLLISSQVSADDGYDPDALEGVMVFVTVLPIVIGGVMIIYTNLALFCTDIVVLCKKTEKKGKGGDLEVGTPAVGGKSTGRPVTMEELDNKLGALTEKPATSGEA